MTHATQTHWIVFAGSECIASGLPQEILTELKSYAEVNPHASIQAFDATTSHPVEIDLRGDLSAILARLPSMQESIQKHPATRAPGRSKLVQAAIDANSDADRKREMTESAYRFMTAIAGNEQDYEEASRALFAGDLKRLAGLVANWSLDVQAQLFKLLAPMIDDQA